MNKLLEISILPVLLTLFAFKAGVFLQKKTKSPMCNPILVAVILVLLVLLVTGMDLEVYQAGNDFLSWLLTPATVCLAISMYEQFQILRKHIRVILVGVIAGAVSSLLMVLALSLIFSFTPEMMISLLPKSVTTAIGVPLCELAGGLPPITTAVIILTGIVASVLGPTLCKAFRLFLGFVCRFNGGIIMLNLTDFAVRLKQYLIACNCGRIFYKGILVVAYRGWFIFKLQAVFRLLLLLVI